MKKKTKFLTVGVMAMLVLVFSAMSVSAQEGSALPECKQHSYEDVIVPATVNADGYTLRRCSVCMTEKDKAIIRQIGGVKLSRTEYHFFNGKAYPDYTVCDADGNEIEEVYGYTVKKPSNPKKPGTYKYVVKFFGRYKGECTAYYKIENPSSTPVLKNIASTSKGVKLDWTLSKEVDYCLVFRKEGAGRWEEIAKVEDKCSYTDLTAVYGNYLIPFFKSVIAADGRLVKGAYGSRSKPIAGNKGNSDNKNSQNKVKYRTVCYYKKSFKGAFITKGTTVLTAFVLPFHCAVAAQRYKVKGIGSLAEFFLYQLGTEAYSKFVYPDSAYFSGNKVTEFVNCNNYTKE